MADDPGRPDGGLTYPLGSAGPDPGRVIEVAPGFLWARLPMPGPLRHVNVWLLEDGEGFAAVDTGIDLGRSREQWVTLLAVPLAGRPITRIVGTHYHPDHIGLAGWLSERFSAPLWMTRAEWLYARMLSLDAADTPPAEAIGQWRAMGWDEARIAAVSAEGWRRYSAVVSPLPFSYRRLCDGDRLAIGAREFRIVVGSGHSPEHACLLDEASGIFVAGDQVLPRISSNISIGLSEPEGNPLGDWLDSIEKLRALPDGLLVLPSHGEPFTGLHARLDALEAMHRKRLDDVHAALAEPRRAVDCFPWLFERPVDDLVYGLASGEAMAHLRHLEREGRAVRKVRDGIHWFGQA